MNKPITFTNPEFVQELGGGLSLFRYELHGLIESVNHTGQRTLSEAINEAKLVISKYMSRNEVPATKVKFLEVESSGWAGVTYDKSKQKWRVTVTIDKKQLHIGHYIKKGTAINEKRKANLKHGFPEFYGMKKISLK